jgi:hypothetical protein
LFYPLINDPIQWHRESCLCACSVGPTMSKHMLDERVEWEILL